MSAHGLTPGLAPVIAGTNMDPHDPIHSIRPLGPLPNTRTFIGSPHYYYRHGSCLHYSAKYPPHLEDELSPPARGPLAYAVRNTPEKVDLCELWTLLGETHADWQRLLQWSSHTLKHLGSRLSLWSPYATVKSAANSIALGSMNLQMLLCPQDPCTTSRLAGRLARHFRSDLLHRIDFFKAVYHQLMRLRFYQIELDNSQAIPTWALPRLNHEIARMDHLYFLLISMIGKKSTSVESAMHVAIREGNLDSVRQLLGAGVDVDILNRKGHTPLMTACSKNHYTIAFELLAQGANPNFLSQDGQCPLSCAMDNKVPARNPGEIEMIGRIVGLLLDFGASIHWTDRNGLPLLHYAIHHRQDRCAADFTFLLLSHGACLSDIAPLRDGRSWMHHLAGRVGFRQTSLFKYIMAEGEQLDKPTERGHTPLFFAARNGCLASLKWLAKQGANLKALDAEGSDLLFYAPFTEEAVQKFFLKHGFDPNYCNQSGATALHFAVVRRDALSVAELMRSGAAQMWSDGVYSTHRDWKHRRNKLRGTPYDIALQLGYGEITRLITIMEKRKIQALQRQVKLENMDVDRQVRECERWYAPFRDMGLSLIDSQAAVQLAGTEEARARLGIFPTGAGATGVLSGGSDGSNSDVENESPEQNDGHDDQNSDANGTRSTSVESTAAGRWEHAHEHRSKSPPSRLSSVLKQALLLGWMEEKGETILPRWLFGEEGEEKEGGWSNRVGRKRFRFGRREGADGDAEKGEDGDGEDFQMHEDGEGEAGREFRGAGDVGDEEDEERPRKRVKIRYPVLTDDSDVEMG